MFAKKWVILFFCRMQKHIFAKHNPTKFNANSYEEIETTPILGDKISGH